MGVFSGWGLDGRWESFEAEHDCVADLIEALRTEGMIVVDVLATRRGVGPQERIVTGRRGKAISLRTYQAIETATARFVEEVDG
jgi:hypothetical protein